MAKLAAALVSLILLASWGWFSWGEYVEFVEWNNALNQPKFDNEPASVPRGSTDVVGFAKYVSGFELHGILKREPTHEIAVPQSNVQIALGAIVAFSATLFFAVTGGTGAIFSIGVTAFVTFFTAAAHLLFSLVLAARVGLFLYGEQRYELHLDEYGVALYCAVTAVTAFVMLMRMRGLVRGEHSQMLAVLKCLVVLMIVGLGLAPVGVPPEFVVYGFHGLYALAALCLLSLTLIGLTYSNYRYD